MATTTPNYGWSVPTSSDYVAQGAVAIETLGDSVDSTLFTALGGNYPGLRLIKKQTIGTAVSSVQVTAAFSATYENYKIVVAGGVASATQTPLKLTFGATATGYYSKTIYGLYSDNNVLGFGASNSSSFQNAGYITTTGLNMNCEVQNPFTATRTAVNSIGIGFATNDAYYNLGGYLNDTTSYTSFTLTPNSGTLTGGTIYVYGYGAS